MITYKKYILIILLLTVSFANIIARNGVSVKLIPSNIVLDDVIQPQFPGGKEALSNFFASSIRYPYILAKIQMEGEVDVKFTVNKEGIAQKIEITKGFDPLADKEVIRAINAVPKWIPAIRNGEPVDAELKLVVTFALNEELLKRVEQMENQVVDEDAYIEFQQGEDTVAKTEELQETERELQNIIQSDTLLNKEPQFPGGREALEAYLKTNLKYPKKALQNRIEGRVVFSLYISPEGDISKMMIFKRLYPDCDEEAFYLIKKMPKWIPGLKDGKPATMKVMLPVSFELPK